MKIISIFAADLMAFHLSNDEHNTYVKTLEDWNDVVFLKRFYDANKHSILGNSYFGVESFEEFVMFISEQANQFDNALKNSYREGKISSQFECLSAGIDLYEILPFVKGKHQVLRLYGIKLDDTVIITGGGIKIAQQMNRADKIIIGKYQQLLLDICITDSESLFDYLNEQDND